jgi:hypothetical protein
LKHTENLWGQELELREFTAGTFVEIPHALMEELGWKRGGKIEMESIDNKEIKIRLYND